MTLANHLLSLMLLLDPDAGKRLPVDRVAQALAAALSRHPQVPPALAVAVAWHESRFDPSACANDRYGGSSWGLMQVRAPNKRCRDRNHPSFFRLDRNAEKGVGILDALIRFHGGDLGGALLAYSGGGKGYAARVLTTMRGLQ